MKTYKIVIPAHSEEEARKANENVASEYLKVISGKVEYMQMGFSILRRSLSEGLLPEEIEFQLDYLHFTIKQFITFLEEGNRFAVFAVKSGEITTEEALKEQEELLELLAGKVALLESIRKEYIEALTTFHAQGRERVEKTVEYQEKTH